MLKCALKIPVIGKTDSVQKKNFRTVQKARSRIYIDANNEETIYIAVLKCSVYMYIVSEEEKLMCLEG